MVAPNLAEEAAQKCPLSCNECAPDDVDAVDDRVDVADGWCDPENKEDQYAPVTRAISEEDLVAPEDDVERGPTLEDKRRMLD